MNISFVIGSLTKEPEKVEGNLSKTLARLNIAVRENYTDKDGNRPVQFFNVSVWGALAENCLKYLHKGSKVAIVGKIQNRMWEADGIKKYNTEIVASEIEFISTPQKKEDEPKDLKPIQDDGLPF
jgi:single-strand DNA-binding protein